MNEQERGAVVQAIDIAMQIYRTDLTAVTTVEHLRSARDELATAGERPSSRWPSLREIPELSDEELRALAKVSETRLGQDLAMAAGVAYELHCGLADVAALSAYADDRTIEFLTDHERAFRERYERLARLLGEVDPAEPEPRRSPTQPRSAPELTTDAGRARKPPPAAARAQGAREAARVAHAAQHQPPSAATRVPRTAGQMVARPRAAATPSTAAVRQARR